MTTALADRTSQPAAPRSGARVGTVPSKGARRPVSSPEQAAVTDPAKAAIAADVMAALAAFGLED